MKTISLIIDIILAIVGFACFFSEGSTFIPNMIGIACFVLLIYKHRKDPQEA